MYRGFSLKINETEIDDLINCILYPQNFHSSHFNNSAHSRIIWDALKENIVDNNSISADKLKQDWFPEIKSDVFLSHSHKDVKLTKKISRLLNEIGLYSFIDSEVWKYSDDLVTQLEEIYYPYAKDFHDKIVAHVNIMLASALTKMLNNTECVLFLNTTNSIIPSSNDNSDKTDSPWIYHELFTTSILPVIAPIRKSRERPGSVLNEASQPQILHTPPLKHLTDLNDSDFKSWINGARSSHYHSLDVLYSLKPLKLNDSNPNVKTKLSGSIVYWK